MAHAATLKLLKLLGLDLGQSLAPRGVQTIMKYELSDEFDKETVRTGRESV